MEPPAPPPPAPSPSDIGALTAATVIDLLLPSKVLALIMTIPPPFAPFESEPYLFCPAPPPPPINTWSTPEDNNEIPPKPGFLPGQRKKLALLVSPPCPPEPK